MVIKQSLSPLWGFPGGSVVKNLPANAGDTGDLGLIPGLGRSPGKGNGTPFQYSCLENPMNRGAWWATVFGVAKSWTRLSTLTHTHKPSVLSCHTYSLVFIKSTNMTMILVNSHFLMVSKTRDCET